MMIRYVQHTLSFVKRYCRRFLFAFSVVLFLLLPSVSSAGLFEGYDYNTYLDHCGADKFDEKYSTEEAKTWPVKVVKALNDALYTAANNIVGSIINLSKSILLLGAAIWLAMYFLKSVSSMATQDAAKILDGAFSFILKVAFVYVLINGGLDNIISWIVTPLLGIGYDASEAIKKLIGG